MGYLKYSEIKTQMMDLGPVVVPLPRMSVLSEPAVQDFVHHSFEVECEHTNSLILALLPCRLDDRPHPQKTQQAPCTSKQRFNIRGR